MTLSKSDFIGIVKTTYTYFSNKERILNNSLAMISIVRMIGILPIEKDNFIITDNYARKLSTFILKKVLEHLMPIHEKMEDTKKSISFNDGLAALMSIEILNDEDMNTPFYTISLLSKIPANENKQQQQIANRVYQALMKLKLPIKRINWIELLTFVENNELDFHCLWLTTTFDQFLSCLERIVPQFELNDNIKDTIITILEARLDNNIYQIGKLNYVR
jgi:hypothetical protein